MRSLDFLCAFLDFFVCPRIKKLHKNTPADLVGLRGRFVYCGLLSSS